MALAIALVITLCTLPLQRFLGAWGAAVAVLFVAWDPFFLALSRQLHPDGLLAALCLLGLLAFLAWLYAGRRRGDLLFSAGATGLALLTKAPSLFLLVTVGALTAITWLRERTRAEPGAARKLWLGLLAWGGVALLVGLIFWPALWVNPLGTARQVLAGLLNQSGGHVNANFFLGEVTDDPGLFFLSHRLPLADDARRVGRSGQRAGADRAPLPALR
ncbi:MAG: phospholipid carrier-dependent glycosyltransferase [Caldilineaceae bacterium]|nr:phospholipid carrier-dependent glycosyltransferase [Caldilineaceae bacterium]